MKRRISKRCIKIRVEKQRQILEKQFQFEPDDYVTRKSKRIYMQQVETHYKHRAFLRQRQTVKTVHSTN